MASDFFITGLDDDGAAPTSLSAHRLRVRGKELAYRARLELNRFEFGVYDKSMGVESEASRFVDALLARDLPLRHDQLKHRVAQLRQFPDAIRCPHCWVFQGSVRPLEFSQWAERPAAELAICAACNSHFQLGIA
jgi:hypothetical protein